MTLTAGPPRPAEVPESPASGSYLAFLLERIHAGSEDAAHELHLHFFRGIKFLVSRQLPSHESDCVAQSVFEQLIDAVQDGEILESHLVPQFLRSLVQRAVSLHRVSPTTCTLVCGDDLANADRVLRSASTRDREVLTRFYSRGQSMQTICREMKISEAQFRAIKSRARDNFSK